MDWDIPWRENMENLLWMDYFNKDELKLWLTWTQLYDKRKMDMGQWIVFLRDQIEHFVYL